MKKHTLLPFVAGLFLLLAPVACQDKFFEKNPPGTASATQIGTRQGADLLLTSAYSVLDGVGSNTDGGIDPVWFGTGTNRVYGDLPSDDAHKGSGAGDQPNQGAFELYSVQPNNDYIDPKWSALYDGANRTNAVLKAVKAATDMDDASMKRITGEARFLRGHYHFDLKRVFNNVPYIDENVVDPRVSNTDASGNFVNIWPQIEADFQYAVANLLETQSQVGRANKSAAKAYLAKVFMYQNKIAEARALLTDVIATGQTSDGKKYGLTENFYDNFNAATKNSRESVFAIQFSVNDGAVNAGNGNWGDILTYPQFTGLCCGFYRPTQNLVNAYKTDTNGLPLLNTFNDSDVNNDGDANPNKTFTPYTGPLDPRLDWTVGRLGIPYLDWGIHPGYFASNGSEHSGPYSSIKQVFRKSQQGVLSTSSGGAPMANANNYTIIRFADVLLMAAEAEVEVGSLEQARAYVNLIRKRAKMGSVVMTQVNPNDPSKGFTKTPAANYVVNEYAAPWADKAVARQAVRFERRLELAMEGHRFFDLVRWGVVDQVIGIYLTAEKMKRPFLSAARFVKGKSEYQPLPEVQIINSAINGKATLKQNPGY
ncbi:MAG: RagB/SusD family nutrient uptake outer membrane protein [Cytophagia bacterium]|nr:MAG: RagB/SusD family nutrient uptake outer membrane protein [Cytophagales bacterium]TAG41346.1 MAG: RagB/SusD family nutrient uptake outer membrane protein [Cytophagia bacterium]TAG83104.1 MAG: RagB/SusD family nutrient uptake outer membrane protein [Cytophagales bacterium]